MKKGRRVKDASVGQVDGVILRATIASVASRQARVIWEGSEIVCQIPSNLLTDRNSLVVGDQVDIEALGTDQYRLLRVAPRKTVLHRGNRKSPGDTIAVAANIDLLIVTVTAKYLANQAGFVEEAVIAARRAGIRIGVFISKTDLTGEAIQSAIEGKRELYRLSVDFVCMGSTRGEYERMVDEVRGKRVVFAGERASGKTTLVQSLCAGIGFGKPSPQALPSTHASTLCEGRDGTQLIDTPGFREFALDGVVPEELGAAFPEIRKEAEGCRFNDCTHVHEEGCMVRDALRRRRIANERHAAYRCLGEGGRQSAKPGKAAMPDYRHAACGESFTCKSCGAPVGPEGAGSQHRNHCPNCLASMHVDDEPGDRASMCGGVMEPVSVWVRKGGEWAVIHRCALCGTLSSNRVAADDNPVLLMSLAVRPLAMTPFPLERIGQMLAQ